MTRNRRLSPIAHRAV